MKSKLRTPSTPIVYWVIAYGDHPGEPVGYLHDAKPFYTRVEAERKAEMVKSWPWVEIQRRTR